MANFVPEGEDNSTSKRPFGGRSPNYVPDPNDTPAVKGLGADGQFDEARRERKIRALKAKQDTWNQTVKQMNRMTVGDATGWLQDLPTGVREVHLLAEEVGQNRKGILSYFPAAGPSTREVWGPVAGLSSTKPTSTN